MTDASVVFGSGTLAAASAAVLLNAKDDRKDYGEVLGAYPQIDRDGGGILCG